MEIQTTPLHLHTDASLKDGLGSLDRMIERAKSIGVMQMAITDHGSLANAVAFSIQAKAAGIKPILGTEGYIAVDGKIGHITILASGQDGWLNLVHLNNAAHASEFRTPAFTVDQLEHYNKGLIILTGCVASPLNEMSEHDALVLGARLKGTFQDRLFAEVMFVADQDTWSRPLLLAKKLALKTVLTNDTHFAYQTDAQFHPMLTQMRAGFSYNSAQLWLKSGRELLARIRAMDRAIEFNTALSWITNGNELGQRIEEVNLARNPSLPVVSRDADKELLRLVQKGFAEKKAMFVESERVYRERAIEELDVIKTMGYSSYFLILVDLLTHAKESGVRVGAGRGSGAGSLVLWLIGITQIDPIRYDLSFDRFLNRHRRGMPDVDVDLDSENRDSVLEYARGKYGALPIATYSRYSHKSLVHDLARAMRIPSETEEELADSGQDSAIFSQVCEEFPGFEGAYDAMIGQIRHKGKHAGGVIISDVVVPIERVAKDVLSVAWTEGAENQLSYAGLVKFDLLGLSALSTLRRLEEKYKIKAPAPYEDPDPFHIFRSGDLAGIFQFSGSAGIRNLTVAVQPDSLDDLTAINALFRPGALDAGTALKYPEYKREPRKVPEIFELILRSTYGIIVYQEQMMAIIQQAIGGTLAEADLARRVITKGGKKTDDPKHIAELNALRDAFVAGCIAQGLTKTEAVDWWGELETHGRYSFNRCLSGETVMDDGRTLSEWYDDFKGGDETLPSVDEESGEIYANRIIDVYNNGMQLTYTITLENGRSIRATKEHKFLTPNGWYPVRALRPGDSIAFVASPNSVKFDPVHGYSKIESIRPFKIEQTFDVEMEADHNFIIANGIISHNSHSTAYSWIAYEMAWWKYYYRADFLAAMLNTDPANSQTYISDALNSGIAIVPPRVQFSGVEWEAVDGVIYIPLSAIKFMGADAAQSIVNSRKAAGGRYSTIQDFMDRNPKKIVRGRARQGLWYLGGFEGVDGSFDDLQLGKKIAERKVSYVAAQREFLGFVIPNRALVDLMTKYSAKGWVCGIIASAVQKISRWGKYTSYRTAEGGFFWSRENHDLEKGWIVAAHVNERNRADTIEIIGA